MEANFSPCLAAVPQERWLPVVGHEGRYEVSDLGNVRSLDRIIEKAPAGLSRAGNPIMPYAMRMRGRVLVPQEKFTRGKLSYLVVTLGAKSGPRKVHHLVLRAFVGPRPRGLEGCHNDGNPANNVPGNLRWDTHLSNVRDSLRHGTHSKPPVAKRRAGLWLDDNDLRCIRAEPHFRGVYVMLGRCFGVDRKIIKRIRLEAA